MRRFLFALTLSLLSVGSVAALAGDCATGYGCQNACPLAQEASTLRADGTEAVRASATVRDVVAATVAKNLDRI